MASPTWQTWIWELQVFVMDREAWHAAVHGITKCWTQLRDWIVAIHAFPYCPFSVYRVCSDVTTLCSPLQHPSCELHPPFLSGLPTLSPQPRLTWPGLASPRMWQPQETLFSSKLWQLQSSLYLLSISQGHCPLLNDVQHLKSSLQKQTNGT